jgi:hypothetical protein
MAMEDRQRQIREGAGLEESRLNVEFIDWLKKYSTPVLMVIAVACLVYFGLTRYRQSVERGLDDAFQNLSAAREARSPANLLAVADKFPGKGSVTALARLDAADLYLEAYRTGVPAGVRVDRMTGNLPEGEKLLTDEQRTQALADAETQYKAVFEATKGVSGWSMHAVSSMFGLAAVAEARGEIDKARGFYEDIQKRAAAEKMTSVENIAKARVETLDQLATAPQLYASSSLAPTATTREVPFTTPMQNMQIRTSDGETVPVGQSGPAQPVQVPAPQTLPRVEIPVPAPSPDAQPASTGPVPATGDPTRAPVIPPASPAPAPAPAPSEPKPAEPK